MLLRILVVAKKKNENEKMKKEVKSGG